MNFYYKEADPRALRENVPSDMREIRRFLLWSEEPAAKVGDKPRKVPGYADGGRRGKTGTAEDSRRLVSFDEAMHVYERGARPYRGIGIALGEVEQGGWRLSGIDLDRCLQEDRVLRGGAQQIVDAAGRSYAEVSPSGTGIKLFGRGDIGTEKNDRLEIYSDKRFFTLTGIRLAGNQLDDLAAAARIARQLLVGKKAKLKKADFTRPPAPGARNSTLFAYASSLRARNVPELEAWSALQLFNARSDPPLDSEELADILRKAWRYPPGFPLTDLGNAERLVALHGRDWKWLPELGWIHYGNGIWTPDRARAIVQVAGQVARSMLAESATLEDDGRRQALAKWAVRCESKKAIDATVALAATVPGVADDLDRFDRDDWLICCRNCVVDLRTGLPREGRREDLLMKVAAVTYDPAATCPQWEQLVLDVCEQDFEMASFLQRAAGYWMTGSAGEQVAFILQGSGANAKSTFVGVLRALLGRYATTANTETFVSSRAGGGRIPNDLAALKGSRLVVINEPEEGAKLAEAMIKLITGEDEVSARFLHKEWFSFTPKMKPVIVTNSRPRVRGSDHAIWRRIVLIPFKYQVPREKRIKEFDKKLLNEEGPGIFNWMLAGCREWQRIGLAYPEKIVEAVRQYRQEEDRITEFVKECVGSIVGGRVKKTDMLNAYVAWCKAHGEEPLTRKAFVAKLIDEKGLRIVHRGGLEMYADVCLLSESM